MTVPALLVAERSLRRSGQACAELGSSTTVQERRTASLDEPGNGNGNGYGVGGALVPG